MYILKMQETEAIISFPQPRNRQKMKLYNTLHHCRQVGKKDPFQVKLVLLGFRRDMTAEWTKSQKDKRGRLRERFCLVYSVGRLGCWIKSN